jgi:ribosomal protein S18 acetylase RimI-like enzyme
MHIEQALEVTSELEEAMQRLVPQLSPAAPVPDAAWLGRLVTDDHVALLLARDDAGRIVGTLTLSWFPLPLGLRAWINDVVVEETARGRGIAETMVREALRRAEAMGAPEVRLTSHPARLAANRLYPRLGFQRRETNSYRYYFGPPAPLDPTRERK